MSVIHTFDIKACRKTSLDWFLGGFLKFKISKRLRPLCLGPCKDQDRNPVFIWTSSVQSPIFYQRLDLKTLLLVLWQAFGASNQLGLNKSHDHVVIFIFLIMPLEAEAEAEQLSSFLSYSEERKNKRNSSSNNSSRSLRCQSLKPQVFFLLPIFHLNFL